LDILNIAYSKRHKESRKNSHPWPRSRLEKARDFWPHEAGKQFGGALCGNRWQREKAIQRRIGEGILLKVSHLPKWGESGFGGGFLYL
jgi:hypothetical protein